MFGFIRPVKSELRVREVDRFQSVYCGLCHTIRKRYGNLHTCFLSYDMTFLALLLESIEAEGSSLCKSRCIASPIVSRCVLQTDAALERAADLSVLLTCLKIEDSLVDESGMKKVGAGILHGVTAHGYRKAQKALPKESEEMLQCMQKLAKIEKDKIPSIDCAADPFAQMMQACVPETSDNVSRILRQILYHMGRWVYLIDACVDIKEDWESGNYNPVALRYELQTPELSQVKDQIELTLARSLAAVHAAFQLLPVQRDRELIENIICLGLPTVTKQVLEGRYELNGGRSKHGSL